MESINFVCLGKTDFVKELGKRGTESDIAIYDRKMNDKNKIMTYTVPIGYPDKIQSLLIAINLAEYAIINVDKLDKVIGEQIVALDVLDMDRGFLLYSYDIDPALLNKLVSKSTVSKFKIIDTLENLRENIHSINPVKSEGKAIIHIDHIFNVKGVGVVILGVLRQGEVSTYDELTLFPSKRKVVIKSIQMHDENVDKASSPARVGLSLKGITVDEISRGDILSNMDHHITGLDNLSLEFKKIDYYKNDLSENQSYLISLGLQIKSVKIKKESDTTLKIISEKPIAFRKGDKAILLNPDSKDIRIIGHGKIL